MKFEGTLQLKGATIDDFSAPPNKSLPKVVLLLRVPTTEAILAAFNIGWAFEDGAPRDQVTSIPFRIELVDYVLVLPCGHFYPEKVHKFRLERGASDEEPADLTFRVHLTAPSDDTAKLEELLQFHFRALKEPFDAAFTPRQGDLFENGSRVDMTKPADSAAAATPPQPPPAAAAAPEPEEPIAPLASVAEMNRRYGAGSRRGKKTPPPAPEDSPLGGGSDRVN